jgi:hypothetical protein
MWRALLVLAVGLAPGVPGVAGAGTAPVLERVVVVGRAAADAPWTDAPTEARAGDGAELAVVGIARAGKKTVVVADADVGPLVLGGKKVGKRVAWDALGGDVAARWSTVEPHAWREAGRAAPNGVDTPFYSNVVSGGARHGEWLGYDEVTYFETPLGAWADGAGARRRAASARPPRAADDVWGGLGTMRYKVEVRVGGEGGRVVASPGAEARDAYGIVPGVHRVSIRRDDTTVGWLTAYFMVPEVFGSAGPGKNHQTERWIGADCADVLVGARRAQGFTKVTYTSVKGLTSYAAVVAGPAVFDGGGRVVEGAAPRGVQAGDLVRIDYGGAAEGSTPRSWDHVAMLVEDRGEPGVLDAADVVAHMGHPMLQVEPLGEQLPARVDVLRWK